MTPENKAAIDAAQKVLEEEKAQRARDCADALQKVLAEFNCDLLALPYIDSEGRTRAQPQIQAK